LILCLGLSLSGITAHADESLYQDLGGRKQIASFTNTFVDIVIHDDRIKAFFVDANIPRLKRLLTQQFCQLSGGPVVYRGRSMKKSHAGRGIRDADFNAVAEDLQTAMDQAKIPYFTQNRLLALLAPMEKDIVTKE